MESPDRTPTHRMNRTMVILCTLLEISIVFSLSMTSLPTARIVENAVCQRWYASNYQETDDEQISIREVNQISEGMCKLGLIQAEVVEIFGGWGISGTLVVLVPAGYLSRVIDRRTFLSLAIIEVAMAHIGIGLIGSYPLSFDPRLFWTLPLFDFIGGGFNFVSIMIRTMIAEGVLKQDLSGVYYRLTGFIIVSKFAGNSIGSWLMSITGPFVVLYLGTFLMVLLTVPIVFMLPRSNPKIKRYNELSSHRRYSGSNSPEENWEDSSAKLSLYQRFHRHIMSRQDLLRSLRRLLYHHRSIRSSLVIMGLQTIGAGSRMSFQNWVSKRYHWTLSKTGVILSFETLGAGILLLFLPMIRDRIVRYSSLFTVVPLPQDLFIATAALACGTANALLLAFTHSAPWFLLSLVASSPTVAFLDGIKSHCISMVEDSEIMLVHMSFTYVQILGNVLNGPLWIKIYQYTYSQYNTTGLGMGLPFTICAVLFIGTLFLIPKANMR